MFLFIYIYVFKYIFIFKKYSHENCKHKQKLLLVSQWRDIVDRIPSADQLAARAIVI